MIVRSRVPRSCSALMRFSGSPHKPNPPHITVAPSGMSATASSALLNTLSMSVIILHQLRAPLRGRGENGLDGVTAAQVSTQLRETLDQAVERLLDRVGIGEADVSPDVRGTRCQPRGVHQSAPGHPQALAV